MASCGRWAPNPCKFCVSIIIMVALWNRADHYIFILSFVLLSSFFLSWPNLSRRRLDVCHTSTHGVALVRIWDAGLKPAARGWLKTQDAKKVAKNRHLGTIAQLCRAISLQLRHVSTIGKNLLSTNMSSTCPHNMVNLLAAEIDPVVWGTLQISTGFTSWQHYCTASSSRCQPNFAALSRGRHLCSAGRPSRWALAHVLVGIIFNPGTQFPGNKKNCAMQTVQAAMVITPHPR